MARHCPGHFFWRREPLERGLALANHMAMADTGPAPTLARHANPTTTRSDCRATQPYGQRAKLIPGRH